MQNNVQKDKQYLHSLLAQDQPDFYQHEILLAELDVLEMLGQHLKCLFSIKVWNNYEYYMIDTN